MTADTSPERVADMLLHLRRESLVVHRTPIGVGGSLLRSADLLSALAAERDALAEVVRRSAQGELREYEATGDVWLPLYCDEDRYRAVNVTRYADAVRAALNETGDTDDPHRR